MSEHQLFDGQNTPLVVSLPAIAEVEALGGFAYVEILSAQEIMKTSLTLTGSTEGAVNEAYILHLGPGIPPSYGLKVGDRVFIDGGITFGPNYKDYKFSDEGRKRGVVLYTAIKGKLIEESADEVVAEDEED